MGGVVRSAPGPIWAGAGFSIILLAVFFAGSLPSLLEFDRVLILHGQWWLLYTGNLTHFTLYHCLMNMAGLMAIVWLLWLPGRNGSLYVALLVIPLGVGAGLLVFDSDTDIYRGFSGALYGLLAMSLLMNFQRDRLISVVGLVVLALKIGYEQLPWFDANYMMSQIGAPVAAKAHLFGVISGVVLFFTDAVVRMVSRPAK